MFIGNEIAKTDIQEEDLKWAALAEERDVNDARFVTHDQAWDYEAH